jgi:protein-L-isoaspartate(D-aspartate) O-methyltransferase
MSDAARQRLNMVESQVRPSDVTDRRILRAMGEIPREAFVPARLASVAYMDQSVALMDTPGRSVRRLMSPRSFAKLVQLAAIEPTDRVLDVGTGRGYSAAVLARLGWHVTALECDPALADAARSALAADPKITVVQGPLAQGWPSAGPYDVIVIAGALVALPEVLLAQLGPGGRLVGVKREGVVGRATLWKRSGTHIGMAAAFETHDDVLPGFETAPAFTF